MNQNFNIPAAYRLVLQQEIPEIESHGYLLEHIKSGARVALLSNEDENKVFTIGFRTPPQDNTGVAHILEHSVLCGSRDFPAKDPFIELAKGSLNTFLNAMTYPDKTVYPVASCNEKDFQNLMHVYMDAVFFPNIYKKEEIFRQEGWSYDIEEEDGRLTYNGVVYNEMKGAYSSPDDVLQREIQHALFPDTPYGFDSGGDPDDIPELSYEGFLAFHSRYYHPCNSYIYLYGDMDMEERLNWMDEAYLSKFERISIDSKIPKQEPFSEMKQVTVEYPVSESESEDENTFLSWSVVCPDVLDEKLYNAFEVISYALISTPGAPIKKALLDAGVGKDVYGGYDNSILQPVFSVVAKNARAEQQDKFLELIMSVLRNIVAEGFDKDLIRGGINSLEFHYRESDYGRFPRGLMYGLRMFDNWLYDDGRPFATLSTEKTMAFLKEMSETDYFERVVEEHLLKNPHSCMAVAVPKRGLTVEKDSILERKLAEYKDSLPQEKVREMVSRTRHLRTYQAEPSTKEELESIPLLRLEDIRKTPEPIQYQEEELEGTKVIRTEVFTGKIAYFNFSFDASDLSEEELPVLGLLKNALTYMGTKQHTYTQLNNLINIHTGGMGANIAVYDSAGACKKMPVIRCDLTGKALYDEVGTALDLAKEVLISTDYSDMPHLLELIQECRSRLGMSLNSSGNSAAGCRALSYYSSYGAARDAVGGISFYHWLEKMEKNFETEKEEIVRKLQNLSKKLFVKENLITGFTGDEEGWNLFQTSSAGLLSELEERRSQTQGQPWIFVPAKKNEGFKTSAQVQYAAQAGSFQKAGYTYDGGMLVLTTILNYEYLWNEIRVKGGAYGCSASFSKNGNDVIFTSYRDPHLKRTYEVFGKIPEFIRNFSCDDRDMLKYVIGTIGEMDTPLTPADRGRRSMNCYFMGTTYEELETIRAQVLASNVESIRKLVGAVEAALNEGYVCAIGNEGKVEESEGIFKEKLSLFH